MKSSKTEAWITLVFVSVVLLWVVLFTLGRRAEVARWGDVLLKKEKMLPS